MGYFPESSGQDDTAYTEFFKSVNIFNEFSQFGEDGIIEAIFQRIGTTNCYAVECGATDGIFFSNTRRLHKAGWGGLLIEADPELAKRCRDNAPHPGVDVTNRSVQAAGKDSMDAILAEHRAPEELDLLVLDIDSYEYYVFNNLLKFRPRVVVVEYDGEVDPTFIPDLGGAGQAGLTAMRFVAQARGYAQVCRTQSNLICVRQDLAHLLDEPQCKVSTGDGFVEGDYESVKAAQREIIRAHPLPEDAPNAAIRNGRLNGSTPKPKTVNIGAAMSTPRIGFLHNSDCILTAFAELGIQLSRGEGVFWHQSLTRVIEAQLSRGVEFVLTCDYDTVFTAKDIAKLWAFLDDNPQIDVACAIQQKREGGAVLATTVDGLQVDMSQPGVPIGYGHFGLTLFRSRTFEKLAKPWFYEAPDKNGSWDEGRIDADIGFWKNCLANEVVVYQANTVIVGHLEQVVTYPDQNLKPLYVPVNRWRRDGMPTEAFDYKQAQSVGVALDMG